MDHRVVRGLIAILVGLPGTFFMGYAALFVAGIGAFSVPFAWSQAVDPNLRIEAAAQTAGYGLLMFVWGAAGLVGIAAFWSWVFLRRPISNGRRIALTVAIVAGIAAVLPITLVGPSVYTWIGALGCITGTLLILDMCFLTSRRNGP
jgi:hypothetical protein